MTVRNLKSSKGNKVANQFEIMCNGVVYFQSYSSTCAKWDGKTLTLGQDWDYSRTTLKYLYIWMISHCYDVYMDARNVAKSSIKDGIQKLIDSGIILYDENL